MPAAKRRKILPPFFPVTSQTYTTDEREFSLLEAVRANPEAAQRDLARDIGISLGMTNAILRRCAARGWLSVRRINNRNLAYAITPAGMERLSRRAVGYFRRTVRSVVRYRDTIAAWVRAAQRRGVTEIMLVGRSELAFILEHFCEREGIGFTTSSSCPSAAVPDRAILLAENHREHCDDAESLQHILAEAIGVSPEIL